MPFSPKQLEVARVYWESTLKKLKASFPELTEEEILNEMHTALFSDSFRLGAIDHCKSLSVEKVKGVTLPTSSGQSLDEEA